jgi:hypothetical protein
MRSTKSWDQKWAARHFSWFGYKLAKQRYWFPNKFHWVWDQMSSASLSFIHPVILIPQCWGTKQSDPENVAWASFWSTNGEDRNIRSTRSWDQKWPAQHFDLPMLGIKTFLSLIFGLRVMLILELWRSNHEIHKNHGIKSGLRGTFHESGINSQNNDIGFQISSTELGSNVNLIPLFYTSRNFDPPMLGHKIIWSRKCGLSVGIKPWDPQDHGIKSGLRGTFHESGINSQNKDIGFQISSTESGIKCQPHPLVLYILQFSSPNAGAQNNLIPNIWPSRHFDPRFVRIKD